MSAAFIVDGLTEKKIIQSICENSPVRMTNLNGKSVSLDAIAKAVRSLLTLLKHRHYPVFIIVDREERSLSSQAMEFELSRLICKDELDPSNIIVSCPDRMIENWILGDKLLLEQELGVEIGDHEGQNGKAILKAFLKEKGLGYHELTVGVELFRKLNPRTVELNSASFHRVKERGHSFCLWLRRDSKRPA